MENTDGAPQSQTPMGMELEGKAAIEGPWVDAEATPAPGFVCLIVR